jgi:hypothetical protein
VAVMRLHFLIFLQPFHDPAIRSDLCRREAGAFLRLFPAKRVIRYEDFR